jgi:hypothetical protein
MFEFFLTLEQVDFSLLDQPQRTLRSRHAEEASRVIIINPTTSFLE